MATIVQGLKGATTRESPQSSIKFDRLMIILVCWFVGGFQVMTAAWYFSPALAVPTILATILTAGYLLWTWQRVFLGTNPATRGYPEVSVREFVVLLPFVLLSIALGVLPGVLVFQWMEPSVQGWVDVMSRLK